MNGLATAKVFTEQGARVAITGQNGQRLNLAADELGPNTLAILADVRYVTQTQQALEEVKKAFGSLDILFVNAGIAHPAPSS